VSLLQRCFLMQQCRLCQDTNPSASNIKMSSNLNFGKIKAVPFSSSTVLEITLTLFPKSNAPKTGRLQIANAFQQMVLVLKPLQILTGIIMNVGPLIRQSIKEMPPSPLMLGVSTQHSIPQPCGVVHHTINLKNILHAQSDRT